MVGLTRFLDITPTANRFFGIYSPILTNAPEVTLVALIALPGPSAFLSLAHIALTFPRPLALITSALLSSRFCT